jgi:hypothetical protein
VGKRAVIVKVVKTYSDTGWVNTESVDGSNTFRHAKFLGGAFKPQIGDIGILVINDNIYLNGALTNG